MTPEQHARAIEQATGTSDCIRLLWGLGGHYDEFGYEAVDAVVRNLDVSKLTVVECVTLLYSMRMCPEATSRNAAFAQIMAYIEKSHSEYMEQIRRFEVPLPITPRCGSFGVLMGRKPGWEL